MVAPLFTVARRPGAATPAANLLSPGEVLFRDGLKGLGLNGRGWRGHEAVPDGVLLRLEAIGELFGFYLRGVTGRLDFFPFPVAKLKPPASVGRAVLFLRPVEISHELVLLLWVAF